MDGWCELVGVREGSCSRGRSFVFYLSEEGASTRCQLDRWESLLLPSFFSLFCWEGGGAIDSIGLGSCWRVGGRMGGYKGLLPSLLQASLSHFQFSKRGDGDGVAKIQGEMEGGKEGNGVKRGEEVEREKDRVR